MSRVLGLIAIALLVSSPAVGQDPRLDARLDSVTRAQVQATVASARAEGLPTEPLIQKALEGSSKRAPGPRITAAVATVLEDLRRARAALGPTARDDELVAAAAALRAGATPEMLGEMQRMAPRAAVAVPLAVFTDLVAGGMGAADAWRSVADLARRGGDDEAFLRLRERLEPASPGAAPEAP
ncbi:MAG TPA: hypothetical protein VFJ50_01860 [Gemmatimonadales bacterium]|nr:hypothetical protein [Gemmatimonadales bacterium]